MDENNCTQAPGLSPEEKEKHKRSMRNYYLAHAFPYHVCHFNHHKDCIYRTACTYRSSFCRRDLYAELSAMENSAYTQRKTEDNDPENNDEATALSAYELTDRNLVIQWNLQMNPGPLSAVMDLLVPDSEKQFLEILGCQCALDIVKLRLLGTYLVSENMNAVHTDCLSVTLDWLESTGCQLQRRVTKNRSLTRSHHISLFELKQKMPKDILVEFLLLADDDVLALKNAGLITLEDILSRSFGELFEIVEGIESARVILEQLKLMGYDLPKRKLIRFPFKDTVRGVLLCDLGLPLSCYLGLSRGFSESEPTFDDLLELSEEEFLYDDIRCLAWKFFSKNMRALEECCRVTENDQ